MAQAESAVTAEAARVKLCADYRPPPAVFDEMCEPNGAVHEHWRYLVGALDQLGEDGLKGRWRESRRLIRDNGVTYNVYGDPRGMSRPWELDLIPLLIRSDDWALIERGLMQRAELLNRILLDLYGPRRLIAEGLLPPELVFHQDGMLLACDGIQPTGDRPLVFYAADLARGADGALRVLGDRTQSPSGAGYALENRIVLSRVLPSLFRDSHVHRLAGFFRTVRSTLRALAPRDTDTVRVVVLTPGPRNEAYFEHAYLANYLGYTLVQGDDLTVRDGAVWLRTLNGLERVDVILRRVDDVWCDPLELRGESLLGIPGLVQAARAGQVTLANALGSGILEHPALAAFLPRICQALLEEELLLPGLQTWWCGNPVDREFVIGNLHRLVIKRVRADEGRRVLFGSALDPAEREALAAEIRARPWAFVGQELLALATAPVLEGTSVVPRAAVTRTFLVAEEGGYAVMPGGLTRAASDQGDLLISSQLGGIGKDSWVLASEPEREESLVARQAGYSPAVRVVSEVSSRVADNLFWIGRYAERAEGLVRLLRIIIMRFTERTGPGRNPDELGSMRLLLRALTHQTLTYPGFVGEGAEKRLAGPRGELLSLVSDLKRLGGLPQTLQALSQAAWSVRDRLSMDTWRVINVIDDQRHALTRHPPSLLGDALDELDPLITALVAFSGLTKENMIQDEGWRFLEAGRRLERAANTVTLLRTTMVPVTSEVAETQLAEAVLGVTDSLITYRRRYQSGTRAGALLDLVLQDESNPRSLAYQLTRLEDLVSALPKNDPDGGRTRAEKLVLEALTTVRLGDIDELANVTGPDLRQALDRLLERLAELLPALSDDLTAVYFRHEDRPHSLLARR